MGKRPTPTVEDLITALDGHPRQNRLGDFANGVLRGVHYSFGVEIVRSALGTTHNKAVEWLMERTTEPGSPLVCLRTSGSLIGPREGTKRVDVPLPGWTAEEMLILAFNDRGDLIPGGTSNRVMLVLRSALEPIHEAVKAYLVEKAIDHEKKTAARNTVFESAHGDALAVIEQWLTLMDRSGEQDFLREQSLIEISDHNFKLYGSLGSLTITVRGDQIEAFAEHIRKTVKEI